MPYRSKYHLPDQQATALLGPVLAAVAELERRTRHYADRMSLPEADRAALLAAEQALASAREALDRIRASLLLSPAEAASR